MKTSKLSGLVLGLASIAFGKLDSSLMVKVGGTYNGLLQKLTHTTMYANNTSDSRIQGSKWIRDTLETENANGIDFSAGIFALKRLNSVFSMGVTGEAGWSFHKERATLLKSLALQDSFFFKLGMAMSVTDWVLLSLGLRGSQLYLSYDKDGVAADNPLKKDLCLSDNASPSNFVLGAFFDANFLIPITENFKFAITVGVHGDLNTPEFSKIGSKGAMSLPEGIDMVGPALVVPVSGRDSYFQTGQQVEEALDTRTDKEELARYTQEATDAYQAHIAAQEVNTAIHNRVVWKAGAGIVYKF